MRHFSFLALFFGLFITGPAFAQSDAPPPAVAEEEAAPAVVEEAAAPEAAAPEVAAPEEEAASVTPLEIEEAVESVSDVGDSVYASIKSQSWPVLAGIILVILVQVLRRAGIEDKLPKGSKALPLVVLALAISGNVGAALLGTLEWSEVMGAVLASAGVSMGGWDVSRFFKSDSISTGSEKEPAGS